MEVLVNLTSNNFQDNALPRCNQLSSSSTWYKMPMGTVDSDHPSLWTRGSRRAVLVASMGHWESIKITVLYNVIFESFGCQNVEIKVNLLKKSFSIIPVVKTSTYKFPKSNIHRPQASKQIGLWRYYTYSCTVSNLKSLLLKVYETNLNNLPWRYRPCTIFSRPAVSSAVSPLQRGNVESRQHECLQSESHRTAGNLDQPEMEIVFYLRYPTKKKKKRNAYSKTYQFFWKTASVIMISFTSFSIYLSLHNSKPSFEYYLNIVCTWCVSKKD